MWHLVQIRSAIVTLVFALGPIASSSYANLVLTILPIQVSNGIGGVANASQQLYLAETNKIWAQAGISFNYLPFTSIESPTFYSLDNQAEVDLLFSTAPGASLAPKTISMWFVNHHFDAYGEANGLGGLSSNRIVVSDLVFAEGRLDTIAHEFGHLLGLDHDDLGVQTNFLMRTGLDRIPPTVITDIFPDGAGLDRLTAAQIAVARADAKLTAVPEPASLVWLVGAFGAVALRRRQRAVSSCLS